MPYMQGIRVSKLSRHIHVHQTSFKTTLHEIAIEFSLIAPPSAWTFILYPIAL